MSTNRNELALQGRTILPAPTFSLPTLSTSSAILTLASLKEEPLVINFWASWCVPCRTEIPLLERSYRAHKGAVTFFGIDSSDSASAAKAFLHRDGVTNSNVFNPQGNVATKYGLFGLATTFFVSATGGIVGRHIGQLSASAFKSALRQAFEI